MNPLPKVSRKSALEITSLGLLAAFGGGAARAAAAEGVVGAWKLVSFNIDEGTGSEKPRFGPDPAGYLLYTASGRMSAVLSGIHRQALVPPPKLLEETGEQCTHSVADFLAYAGRYEVKGNHVFHHVECSVFTSLVGTTLERAFTLDGDTLTIRTLPPEIWGSSSVLVWTRT